MLFVEIIFTNLRHRPLRTLLTASGICVAVTAMTTLWCLAWGYAESAKDFYAARGVDIVVVRAGVSNRLTSSLRAELAERIRSLAGVADVDGSLTDMVSVGDADLLGIPLRGLVPKGFAAEHLPLTDGRPLAPGDEGVVLLGQGIADALGTSVGQPIRVENNEYRVAGVFAAGNPFDSNSVIATLSDVQHLMGRPGIVSELQVRADDSIREEGSLRRICREIEGLRDAQQQPLGLKAQPTHQFVDSATEAKLGTSLAWAVSIIVLALSFVGMLNTMMMSVSERTRDLGVLRAIGWKRGRLIRMILGECFVISLAGAGAGGMAAWLLVRGLSMWSRTSLLAPPTMTTFALAPAFAGAIAATIAGALYPAWRAASVTPIESLRHE